MTTHNAEFSLAQDRDFSAIVRLNELNFIKNLSESEREDGFLSAIFSLEQIAAMAGDLGITIATVDGALAGFLCAFHHDFDHGNIVEVADIGPRTDGESRNPTSDRRIYPF